MRKMREGGVDDDKGMVSDLEGVSSLGGREMLSSVREVISGYVVVVALVVGAVGAVGLVVLMEVLMIVEGVLYMGAVEVDFSLVVDIFVLGGFFVVVVVVVKVELVM